MATAIFLLVCLCGGIMLSIHGLRLAVEDLQRCDKVCSRWHNALVTRVENLERHEL